MYFILEVVVTDRFHCIILFIALWWYGLLRMWSPAIITAKLEKVLLKRQTSTIYIRNFFRSRGMLLYQYSILFRYIRVYKWLVCLAVNSPSCYVNVYTPINSLIIHLLSIEHADWPKIYDMFTIGWWRFRFDACFFYWFFITSYSQSMVFARIESRWVVSAQNVSLMCKIRYYPGILQDNIKWCSFR